MFNHCVMYLWYSQFFKHAVVQYSYCNRAIPSEMLTFPHYVCLPSFPSYFFCFLVSLSCAIHCSFCYTISSSPVYLLSLSSSLSFSQSFFPFVLNLFFSLSFFFSACLTLQHQSHISALLSL